MTRGGLFCYNGRTMVVSALLGVPLLVKVLGVLALILVFNALVRNLLISILAGSLVMGAWLGHGAAALGRIAWQRFSSADNLLLMGVFFLIIWLSTLMSETGVMRDMVGTVQARIPHRLSFAVLPAIIGLLPMPGGALFSAPLVESADSRDDLPAGLKTRTNYWFRHVWEYCWPLYPAVILALDLSGLPVWQFVLVQLPVCALAIASGALFLLRPIPRAGGSAQTGGGRQPPSRSFVALIAPILTVVGVYALLLLLPWVSRLNRYLPMGAGLLAALGVLQLQRGPRWALWRQAILSRRTLGLALLVAALRIYAALIEAPLPDGGAVVEGISGELARYGVPQMALLIVLPFLTGLALGINVGVVGTSLPVVLSLLGSAPSFPQLAPTLVLSFAWGFLGQLLSPVHVCLIVSNQYFKTSLYRSLLELLPPTLLLAAGVLLYWRALVWLLPLL